VSNGRAIILRGDAAALPLPDASVDLIMCSPPYFGLRSYTDAGEHYDGQIGSEPAPRDYLEALWMCTAEWIRVLKPEGSLFVNLGDKYAQDEERSRNGNGNRVKSDCVTKPVLGGRTYTLGRKDNGVPRKSLIGLPWRYAIGAVDQLGLILRAEIIWDKPNGLPESVTDRVRRSHEQVFHFTKQPRYYAAVDEVREAHAPKTLTHRGGGESWGNERNPDNNWGNPKVRVPDPLGKLPGSVWAIPSAPLTVPEHLGIDHFAAYPPELCRRIILGWSPPGICTECGQGRRPVMAEAGWARGKNAPVRDTPSRFRSPLGTQNGNKEGKLRTLTGYACACPHPTASATPAIILDPFGGTGTTALTATVLGRTGITIDRSHDYSRLARWRTQDPAERARAMQVPKPPPIPDGQYELFSIAGL